MGCREEDSHNLLFIYCHLTDRDEYEHDRVWRRKWGWFGTCARLLWTSWEQNCSHSFLSLKLECSVITHQSEHQVGSQRAPGVARNLKALNDIYIVGCYILCIVDHSKFAKYS